MAKSALMIWSFHVGKIAVILQNCKSSGIVLGLIGAAFITPKTAYSWRDFEAISKEVTLLCSRTHHIQAAGTRCCYHRVLDHWRRTGY